MLSRGNTKPESLAGWYQPKNPSSSAAHGLTRLSACLQLIAKCETRQSLFNFKAIAQEADAIMLSRGNLGLDVLPEKMALVQKHVIQQCNLLGKPAIVTRVVDTMISSPRPTR